MHSNARELVNVANGFLSTSYELEDPTMRESLIASQLGNADWGLAVNDIIYI
jgi:hypothetical protein